MTKVLIRVDRDGDAIACAEVQRAIRAARPDRSAWARGGVRGYC